MHIAYCSNVQSEPSNQPVLIGYLAAQNCVDGSAGQQVVEVRLWTPGDNVPFYLVFQGKRATAGYTYVRLTP